MRIDYNLNTEIDSRIMNNYLKKLSNLIVYIVTLLGVLALIEKRIDPLVLAIIIEIILLGGFIFLTLSHILNLERKIRDVEQKFIRAKELEDIRNDIKLLKNISKIK